LNGCDTTELYKAEKNTNCCLPLIFLFGYDTIRQPFYLTSLCYGELLINYFDGRETGDFSFTWKTIRKHSTELDKAEFSYQKD